jgi:hypothetical protein
VRRKPRRGREQAVGKQGCAGDGAVRGAVAFASASLLPGRTGACLPGTQMSPVGIIKAVGYHRCAVRFALEKEERNQQPGSSCTHAGSLRLTSAAAAASPCKPYSLDARALGSVVVQYNAVHGKGLLVLQIEWLESRNKG